MEMSTRLFSLLIYGILYLAFTADRVGHDEYNTVIASIISISHKFI